MQRVLVILAVIALVTVSLGVGALTADWPFWRRAWAWHAADGGWPSGVPGPRAVVRGGDGVALEFAPAAAALTDMAQGARTQLLLRVRAGQADAWFAPGTHDRLAVEGHGLAAALLPPLFTALEQRHAGLLDSPVGAWIDAWRQDQRGALTPRQLLAQALGGIGTVPVGTALNPFSSRARLVGGPDFHQAAMGVLDPPTAASGTAWAAAAQLLGGVAAAVGQVGFAPLLEREVWSRLARDEATLLLDHRRGTAAVHCCVRASAADWLRLGLALADAPGHGAPAGGETGGVRALVSGGRALLAGAPGHALLWVGEGAPPSGLETLLEPLPAQRSEVLPP